jgi:hypothetical protein
MEQNTKPETLLTAATEATKRLQIALGNDVSKEDDDYLEGYNKGFQHGAQWQKERERKLMEAAERALNYLNVKYPVEAEILHDLKQGIEKYNS